MRAIITRGLYIFYSLFEGQGGFFRKFCLHVWLEFKGGLLSRAGYDAQRAYGRIVPELIVRLFLNLKFY